METHSVSYTRIGITLAHMLIVEFFRQIEFARCIVHKQRRIRNYVYTCACIYV